MLSIEQKVNGNLIATCKIRNIGFANSTEDVYSVKYITTEYHKKFPNRNIQFELNHVRSEGMEKLTKKIYEELEKYLF